MNNLNAIVCVDNHWAIGGNGRLLFHLPADLKNFKELTAGGSLLMGRRTFDSLPGLLPGRAHVVLSRDPAFMPKNVKILRSIEDAKAFAAQTPALWLIGGTQMYAALLPFCGLAYVTKVDAAVPGADAFFPNIDALPQWRRTEEGPWLWQDGIKFQFCRYENNAPL